VGLGLGWPVQALLVPVLWRHVPQRLNSTELLEQGYSARSGLLCNVPHISHNCFLSHTQLHDKI